MTRRIDHIRPFSTPFYDDNDRRVATLLWGDRVRHLDERVDGYARVFARGKVGWVAEDALGGESLLEVYVIDVGQGDGVLIKTPDGKLHLIDGGASCHKQMTGKSVANFVRWKVQRELGDGADTPVRLQNVFLTHPDDDHYGGLIDLLAGAPNRRGEREFTTEVENFYHNGLGRFAAAPELGAMARGQVAAFPNGEHGLPRQADFITELLTDKRSFAAPARPFKGASEPAWTDFAHFAALIGEVPTHVRRLSHHPGYLPGYDASRQMQIRVLGPIVESLEGGGQGLRKLPESGKQAGSVTRNGHSLVLRLDYKHARILLTGDLNAAAQRLLLSYHPAGEFAADVAKASHHGSADIHMDFLAAVAARASVISSGDNEDYSHPRPVALGASAWYGRQLVDAKGKVCPPLVYSTELARSVKLDMPLKARVFNESQPLADVEVSAHQSEFRRLDRVPVSTNLVYGLVNIRTDGRIILCATLEEKGNDFDIHTFAAGVDAPVEGATR